MTERMRGPSKNRRYPLLLLLCFLLLLLLLLLFFVRWRRIIGDYCFSLLFLDHHFVGIYSTVLVLVLLLLLLLLTLYFPLLLLLRLNDFFFPFLFLSCCFLPSQIAERERFAIKKTETPHHISGATCIRAGENVDSGATLCLFLLTALISTYF